MRLHTNTCYKLFILMLSISLIACSRSTTQITASWKSDELKKEKEYNNIFVATLSRDMEAKEVVEGQLAALLEQRGLKATPSIEIFPENFAANYAEEENEILKKVRDSGHDAILTVSLVDQESENRYVPGNDTYAPAVAFSYYDKFHTYYSYNYNEIYTPGYYALDRVYYLETNLYDAESEQLVWSAQSDTYNPGNIDTFAEDLSEAIVDQLRKESLIKGEVQ